MARLYGVGLALIALGWLLPASKAGYQLVRPFCIGGGALLVAAAQLRMMRLPTDPTNDDARRRKPNGQ